MSLREGKYTLPEETAKIKIQEYEKEWWRSLTLLPDWVEVFPGYAGICQIARAWHGWQGS